MTNTYRLLLDSTGLSLREAALLHNAKETSVYDWSSGRRNPPDGVLYELSELIDRQNQAAEHALDLIEQHPNAEPEIGYCADDHEAQSLGWPCKSAHDAVIRRVFEWAIEELRQDIDLVPRGSTAATAKAADQHKK